MGVGVFESRNTSTRSASAAWARMASTMEGFNDEP